MQPGDKSWRWSTRRRARADDPRCGSTAPASPPTVEVSSHGARRSAELPAAGSAAAHRRRPTPRRCSLLQHLGVRVAGEPVECERICSARRPPRGCGRTPSRFLLVAGARASAAGVRQLRADAVGGVVDIAEPGRLLVHDHGLRHSAYLRSFPGRRLRSPNAYHLRFTARSGSEPRQLSG